ncbi:McrC family protein [Umezawaea endophytica]|uniref:McrC family protein n=1 Tax=Umezawaea endophytica TaxID=1654476 RepID=A0A9X3AI85_9PSEU|nr:McrC family protein [Umezawaea endophytica]MCS7482732.1 McrC family protein [Umezawaea endophytica]
MRRRHDLVEQQDFALGQEEVSDADLELLTGKAAKDLFSMSRTREGWSLRVKGVAGVLVLDRVTLAIRPKFDVSGEMLLSWLNYATTPHSREVDRRRTWSPGASGLVDLIITAFLHECRTLLRGQLRKDYRRRETVDVVLRGRLDFAKQATRRFGVLDKLHVTAFDRQIDVWENQVCGAALLRAARLAGSTVLSRDAADLATQFPTCTTTAARAALARARHHRMNHRYQPAHAWAGILLNAGGVSDLLAAGSLTAGSLLLDMNRLWEAVVRRMVVDAARLAGATVVAGTGANATRVHRPGHSSSTLMPDVLVRSRSGLLAVDAKYKRFDRHAVHRDDIYQLLAYASAYRAPGIPRAVIVHPTCGVPVNQRQRVEFRLSPLAHIDVVGTAVDQHPADGVPRLAEALFGQSEVT